MREHESKQARERVCAGERTRASAYASDRCRTPANVTNRTVVLACAVQLIYPSQVDYRSVVFFDQLGCGRSAAPTPSDTAEVRMRICVPVFTQMRIQISHIGWLRLVGSLKLQVSFATEPYKRDDILEQRPVILRNLLFVAPPYSPVRGNAKGLALRVF